MIHNSVLEAANRGLYPDSASEILLKNGEFSDTFFSSRDYVVRFARPDDINELMEIEAQCWDLNMQTDQSIIEKRLIDQACFTFVLEYEGRVIGCNYSQRINKENIKEMNISTIDKFRLKNGSCIQLITINILPQYQDRGWGNELLEFILQYASLHTEIKEVCAITRCRDFRKSNFDILEEYLKSIYKNDLLHDPTLLMHQLHGAKVLGLIKGYRPKDYDNQGYGILIEYDVKNRPWGRVLKETMSKKAVGGKHKLLEHIKSKLGTDNLQQDKTIRELGFDSMDFVELLMIINECLGTNMKVTDLKEKTVEDLLTLDSDEEEQVVVKSQKPLKSRIRELMRQYEELVPLVIEGDGPCTFWIHPLSGDVGIYNSIAELSEESFKVLAIKATGFLSNTKQPLKSIKDMAKYYCDIILATDPVGPYNLIGFSFGGTIAYEIVRLLQERGKKVANLIMIESLFVTDKDAHLFKTSYRTNLLMNANFMLLTLLKMNHELIKKDSNGEVNWEFYKITEEQVKHVSDENIMMHIVKLCKEKGLKQSEESLMHKLDTMAKVHISNIEAIQTYRIERLPDSNALKTWLFRTSLGNATSRNIWNPDYLEAIQNTKGSLLPLLEGWNSVILDMETIVLDGDNHFDILHDKSSVATFYDYCKRIVTGELKTFKSLRTDNNVNSNVNRNSHEGVKSGKDTNLTMRNSGDDKNRPIAIVGMSGIFPDADNILAFWNNIKNGRNSIREFPKNRGFNIDDYFDIRKKTPGKTYSKWGGLLKDIDKFDPLFFKIAPKEAQLMDPSERLFLQEAWHAIEDAGYNPRSLSGRPWGVFSCAKGDYAMTIQEQIKSYYVPTDSYAASRLSYLLNLVGPSMVIDTACSSTLSVVAAACNSLILGDCEAAVVGGGAVYTTPNILIGSSQSLLLSPDGQCFTFDDRANGTVVAEAIGAVILKTLDKALQDKDNIYGVIIGWGMNQDGKTNGLTAPSGQAQTRLQTDIYNRFDINPENIMMIEAHGTGTILGDSIEFNALTDSFRKYTAKENYCALGSLKTNIGHAFFGAGIAGFIKTSLAVKYGQIPPSLNYENPSPKIELEGSPFYVNRELREWQTPFNQPRCAAISAFGATGTNVHLVIQEYIPQMNYSTKEDKASGEIMFILSAKDESRLKAYAEEFLERLEMDVYKDADLKRIGYTLQVGREHMSYRLGMIVKSIEEIESNIYQYLNRSDNKNNGYKGFYVNKVNKNNEIIDKKVVQEAHELWITNKHPRLLDLWMEGNSIDWNVLYDGKLEKISLPVYPFAKERYWIETVRKKDSLNMKRDNVASITANTSTSVVNDAVSNVANSTISGTTSKSANIISSKEKSENCIHQNKKAILMSFTEEWEEQSLKTMHSSEKETMVCFLSKIENQKNLIEQLKKYNPNANVVFIARNKSNEEKSLTKYIIDEKDRQSYVETFRRINAKYDNISSILYLWAYEDQASDLDYVNILNIYQVITQEKIRANRLLLGGIDGQKIEGCYLDSWIGFERSLGPMMSRTRIKVVIHKKNPMNRSKLLNEDIKQILQEISVESGHGSVLYKEGKRHIYRLNEQELSGGESAIKEGGTYLIIGGLGALGFIISKHLAKEYKINIILTGRKALDIDKQMRIKELEKLGSKVLYVQADVCDQEAMKKVVEVANQQFSGINGVIHAAGMVYKESVEQKFIENFEKVLKPKVLGTQIIDELLVDQQLDFICYFSSAAAVLGDFGACDYSVANRFQVAYAHYRNALKSEMRTFGKAIAINWPIWRDGGMGLGEENNNKYLESSGQEYLETADGLMAFEKLLAQIDSQYLLIKGYPNRVREFLKINKMNETIERIEDIQSVKAIPEETKKAKSDLTQEMVEEDIKILISNSYAIPYEKMDVNNHLIEYGFDSINLFDFANKLEDTFGFKVTPAILLSYSTISRFAEYLMNEFRESLEIHYQQGAMEEDLAFNSSVDEEKLLEEHMEGLNVPHVDGRDTCVKKSFLHSVEQPIYTVEKTIDEPIAVIGMSGVFPKANTVDKLWENLYQNKECISEVPKERWDWRRHSEKLSFANSGKWGGFIEDITTFDPLFFGISPSEASIMDPCQRLFVQEAWHAFEDAGYMGEKIKGVSCGVYVGIEEGEYGFMAKQQGIHYSNQNAVLSARIAYALDLKGPNMSITASCSSGLVALHEACQALRHGECHIALAGGVNVFVSPSAHIGMGMLDLISPTGKSYVFDNRADGLVPSEAVAAVVLKPLSKAIRDNDNIYGCIRGSGINSNGKGHGIMSPNPLRQAELMQNTWNKYGVNPLDISYIISHSIGTQLGDAAEIEGLSQAFRQYKREEQHCYLTSIKPVVGHTFAASGIVSLITMLMSIKYGIRLGMPSYEQPNENIDLTKTLFIIQREHGPWTTNKGQKKLGAISTSANSGTNAFAIIEEYQPQVEEIKISEEKGLYVFSAKTDEQLKDMMMRFLNYLENQETVDVRNLAYTLQLGREAMSSRIAIIANNQDELVEAIRCYIRFLENQGKVIYSVPVFTGNTHAMNNKGMLQYNTKIIEEAINNNLSMLASYWIAGGNVPWENFYKEKKAKVISLPTYPFRKEPYWLKDCQNVFDSVASSNVIGNGKLENKIYNNEDNILDNIINYFSKVLRIPKTEFNINKPLQEYGLDSILAMRLKRYLESKYPIRISIRDIWMYPSISELAAYLEKKYKDLNLCNQESQTSHINKNGDEMIKEYKDEDIIKNIEQYLRGDITLCDLEKSIGVEK